MYTKTEPAFDLWPKPSQGDSNPRKRFKLESQGEKKKECLKCKDNRDEYNRWM